MRSNTTLPSLFDLKGEARAMRRSAQASNKPLSHQQALHTVAQIHGHKNWETLLAAMTLKVLPSFGGGDGSAVAKPAPVVSKPKASLEARNGWLLGEVGPQVLFSLNGELYVRSENYGESVSARLVYPLPPRTTVRRFPADTFVQDPSEEEWKCYDAAYAR